MRQLFGVFLTVLCLAGCARVREQKPQRPPQELYDLTEEGRWLNEEGLQDGIQFDFNDRVLWIPYGKRLDFFLAIPNRSTLDVEELTSRGDPEAVLTIELTRSSGEMGSVGSFEGRRGRLSAPILDGVSKISRLSFVAASPRSAPGGFVVREPRIFSPARPERRLEPPAKKPNIIIYLVDTLRRDHLGTYGYPVPVSPRLDAFSAEATVYTNAVASSAWTRPSVASILTGQEPNVHGVNSRDDALSPEATTLAERLSQLGYETAAFITNGNVGREFGFAQGFDVFSRPFRVEYHADELNGRVFPFLRSKERKEPFFAYIHAVDPHAPYEPFPPYLECFAGNVKNVMLGQLEVLSILRALRLVPEDERVHEVVDLYDAEVAFNDEYFGRLLDELKRLDLYEQSLIFFVADHGEEFWDHGVWGHGHQLYTEEIDIPLVVKAPHQKKGRRDSRLAQQIDIFATALDYAGAGGVGPGRGRSLRLPDTGDLARAVYSKIDVDTRRAVSVTEERWRLIVPQTRNVGLKPWLFDRVNDPLETNNLYEKRLIIAEYMAALLRKQESYAEENSTPATKAVMSEETIQELKALGYLE